MGRKGGEKYMDRENNREPNHAIGAVVKIVNQLGEPFTFDRETVKKLVDSDVIVRPFSEAFHGFSHPLQERITGGVESMTVHPDGRIARFRTDGGH